MRIPLKEGRGGERRPKDVHHPSTLVHWWVLVHPLSLYHPRLTFFPLPFLSPDLSFYRNFIFSPPLSQYPPPPPQCPLLTYIFKLKVDSSPSTYSPINLKWLLSSSPIYLSTYLPFYFLINSLSRYLPNPTYMATPTYLIVTPINQGFFSNSSSRCIGKDPQH